MRWLVCVFAALSITAADYSGAAASADPLPRYEHIFLIILENRSYEQIIGNPNAPDINRLAMTYGLASRFYAEVHPSEGNYVAMIGGFAMMTPGIAPGEMRTAIAAPKPPSGLIPIIRSRRAASSTSLRPVI